jgi:hypothetical protein
LCTTYCLIPWKSIQKQEANVLARRESTMKKTGTWLLCLFLGCAAAGTAHAHITMTGALLSRGGDQKMSPCDGTKGDGPTYTFEPGATITLALTEAIAHPGYFRIAFDNDGDDGFVEPASIKPIEKTRACPVNADDQCGESDFCNVVSSTGATVLWDNLNPHVAADAKNMSWNIKLPDIECENCTIQVLQIMEDSDFHGAYCPQGSCANAAASLEDIYHRCIDIKLKKGATNSPGTTTAPVNNMGMQCMAEGPLAMNPDAGVPSAGTGAADSAAGTDAAAGAAAGGSGGTSAGAAGAVATAGAPSAGPASTPRAGASGAAPSGAAGSVGTASSPVSSAGTGTAGAAPVAGTAAPAPEPELDEVGSCSVMRPSQRGESALIPFTLLLGLGLVVGRRARRRQTGPRQQR